MLLSSVALCVPLFDKAILPEMEVIRPIYIFHILYSIFDIYARFSFFSISTDYVYLLFDIYKKFIFAELYPRPLSLYQFLFPSQSKVQ